MPELPEVETMRRGILSAQGSRIVDALRIPCRLKPIAVDPSLAVVRRRCRGRVIEDVGRVGKRVVLRLDNQCRLIFEPRMTGLVLVSDPPNLEHLRFRLDLDGGPLPHIWYWDRRGLGLLRCWTAEEFATRLGAQLGPDALSLSADQLRQRLQVTRRAIKVALLDQRLLAGVGNLYASEILHRAGIHPARPCAALTAAQWRRLHAAQHEILNAAIEHEGSTLSDGTYRNALNDPGGYQHHHRVYERSGETCATCGQSRIRRMVQAQRSTFFCPRCQQMRGGRA
jgi:formamidopyrimidine-DNA glycosylase